MPIISYSSYLSDEDKKKKAKQSVVSFSEVLSDNNKLVDYMSNKTQKPSQVVSKPPQPQEQPKKSWLQRTKENIGSIAEKVVGGVQKDEQKHIEYSEKFKANTAGVSSEALRKSYLEDNPTNFKTDYQTYINSQLPANQIPADLKINGWDKLNTNKVDKNDLNLVSENYLHFPSQFTNPDKLKLDMNDQVHVADPFLKFWEKPIDNTIAVIQDAISSNPAATRILAGAQTIVESAPYTGVDQPGVAPALSRGVTKGIGTTFLGSSQSVQELFNTRLYKSTKVDEVVAETVGQVVGTVASYYFGGKIVKSLGFAKASMPVLFATLGQTSTGPEVSIKARLAKIPLDVFAGWVFSNMPVLKDYAGEGWKVLLKEAGIGVSESSSVVAGTTFVEQLIQGKSKEEAAKIAGTAGLVAGAFYIAANGLGLFSEEITRSKHYKVSDTYTPEQIRDTARSFRKLDKTEIADQLEKKANEAEIQNKLLKVDSLTFKRSYIAEKFGLNKPEGVIGRIKFVDKPPEITSVGQNEQKFVGKTESTNFQQRVTELNQPFDKLPVNEKYIGRFQSETSMQLSAPGTDPTAKAAFDKVDFSGAKTIGDIKKIVTDQMANFSGDKGVVNTIIAQLQQGQNIYTLKPEYFGGTKDLTKGLTFKPDQTIHEQTVKSGATEPPAVVPVTQPPTAQTPAPTSIEDAVKSAIKVAPQAVTSAIATAENLLKAKTNPELPANEQPLAKVKTMNEGKPYDKYLVDLTKKVVEEYQYPIATAETVYVATDDTGAKVATAKDPGGETQQVAIPEGSTVIDNNVLKQLVESLPAETQTAITGSLATKGIDLVKMATGEYKMINPDMAVTAPKAVTMPTSNKQPGTETTKMWYRGGGTGETIKGMTAQDIVNYEINELGNQDIKVESGINLASVPSERVKWLTETAISAKQYGQVTTETGNYRILARDSEGGVLVDTKPVETMTKEQAQELLKDYETVPPNALNQEDKDKIKQAKEIINKSIEGKKSELIGIIKEHLEKGDKAFVDKMQEAVKNIPDKRDTLLWSIVQAQNQIAKEKDLKDFIAKKQTSTATERPVSKPTSKVKEVNPIDIFKKFVPKRPQLPILGMARVQDGTMTMTDLEMTVEVPSKLEEGLYQTIGKDFVAIKGIALDEYPMTPEEGKEIATTDGEELANLFKNHVLFASSEEIRPILTGINLKYDGKVLRLATTDGYRAYISTIPLKADKPFEYNVPIAKLAKVTELFQGKVSIKVSEIKQNESQYMEFSGEGGKVFIRDIEGQYPDYTKIIPSYETAIKIDKTAFADAITKVTPYATNSANISLFNINQERTVLSISATDHETKATKTVEIPIIEEPFKTEANKVIDGIITMPIRTGSGEQKEGDIGFNVRFMADNIKAIDGDTMYLALSVTNPALGPAYFNGMLPKQTKKEPQTGGVETVKEQTKIRGLRQGIDEGIIPVELQGTAEANPTMFKNIWNSNTPQEFYKKMGSTNGEEIVSLKGYYDKVKNIQLSQPMTGGVGGLEALKQEARKYKSAEEFITKTRESPELEKLMRKVDSGEIGKYGVTKPSEFKIAGKVVKEYADAPLVDFYNKAQLSAPLKGSEIIPTEHKINMLMDRITSLDKKIDSIHLSRGDLANTTKARRISTDIQLDLLVKQRDKLELELNSISQSKTIPDISHYNNDPMVKALDFEVDKIRELDPENEGDKTWIKHGSKYEITVSYPASLGEMGNSTDYTYTKIPTPDEIAKDMGQEYLDTLKTINEEVIPGVVSKTGRDENIEKAINKAFSAVAQMKGVEQGSKSAMASYATLGGYADLSEAVNQFNLQKAIEFPEIVRLAKELMGQYPEVSKIKATKLGARLGLFEPTAGGKIKLNRAIFQFPDLAPKVLAHEIGHLFDYLPERTMSRGGLVERIMSLNKHIKGFYEDHPNKDVKEELKKMSQMWKPFDEKRDKEFTNYRYSAPELYADAISVLLNAPDLLKENAPLFWQGFFDYLDNKPEVSENYFALQDLLTKGEATLLAERQKAIRDMFRKGEDIQSIKRLERLKSKKDFLFRLKLGLVDKNQRVIDKVNQAIKEGKPVQDESNPRYLLEGYSFVGGVVKDWIETDIQPIYKTLTDKGLTWEDMEEVTFLERIVNERGATNNPVKFLKENANDLWLEIEQDLPGDIESYPASKQIKTIKDKIDEKLKEGVEEDEFASMQQVFNVLPKGIANPLGYDRESAQRQLDFLKDKLGEEKWSVLKSQADLFHKSVKGWLVKAAKAQVYSPESVEKMLQNPSYAAFQVLDYLDTYIPASIKQQVGTLKEVAGTATATVMKTISLIRAIERNKVKLSIVNDLLKQKFPGEIKPARTIWTGKTHIPMESKNKDEALFTLMEEGKYKGYYIDPYIAESMEHINTGTANAIVEVFKFFNNKLFYPLFITFNMGFQSFNFNRDFMRAVKNYPSFSVIKSLFQVAKGYKKALGPAYRRTFDLPDKTISEMYQKKILSTTFNDLIKGQTDQDKQIDVIMERVGLSPLISTKKKFYQPILDMLRLIEKTGNLIETLPKVGAYMTLQGKMPEQELAHYIRTAVGSPNFMAKGTYTPVTNAVFLFSNAIIQGTRADLDIAFKNPRTRSGFWWKTAWLTWLPKLLMFMVGLGLLGKKYKDMMDGVSEYDKTNYTIIPLGLDKNDKTVYIRVPQDETGRLLGGIFWKALWLFAREDKNFGKDIAELMSFTGGQLPSISPLVDSMSATLQFVSGKNPYDAFRGQNVIPDEAFKAGGKYALKPFVIWQLNNLGIGTIMKTYTTTQAPETKTWYQKVLELPILSNILGRWVKVSDYGKSEQLNRFSDAAQQKEAIRRQQEKELIDKAISDYRSGDQSMSRRLQTERNLVKQVVGNPPYKDERKTKETNTIKKFRIGVVKGQADANVNALIYATSNAEKLDLLREIKTQMTDQEFKDLKKTLLDNKIVSKDVFSEL